MNLGPAIIRRENALSQMLPRPRFVKLNTDALLRMDPASRAQMLKVQIDARTLAPSEARALDNRKPFTVDQIAEFDELGLNKKGSTPETSIAPQRGPDPFISTAPPGGSNDPVSEADTADETDIGNVDLWLMLISGRHAPSTAQKYRAARRVHGGFPLN